MKYLTATAARVSLLALGVMLPGARCRAAWPTAGDAAGSPWVATWGTAMVETGINRAPDLTGHTLRLIVHSSAGGSRVRIWLSNRFGTAPLHLGAAHIAVSAVARPKGNGALSGILPGTDRALTFNHQPTVTLPPGATISSDGVALEVPPLSNLAISLYFPGATLGTTEHGGAQQISYAATGNQVSAPVLDGSAWTIGSWYFLTGVDVYAPGDSAVVAFGDSITDGNHSTQSANRRWPDDLAARLAGNEATRKAGILGVVNAGISGNRVLLDGDGPNAMARLNWDILERSGARYLILFHGINDIEAVERDRQPFGTLEQRLEWALTQITEQAHEHGMRVLAATQMTDCRDHQCKWPEGEKTRDHLNHWIRTARIFDGLLDFDRVMRDPQYPTQMREDYNSGDYVHPNDAGYQAMADSIDLNLFTGEAPGEKARVH
ncbi:MAG: SGNH/GDSL hydrolase family protein [Acidobacteriota bacterium]|nr:SGNH/GDSL hydrolase family protein [Acidobacteriota bacterium]